MTQPMTDKFFFITNYDDISSQLISFILNAHPDIHCSMDNSDDLLSPCQRMSHSVDEWIMSRTQTEKLVNGNVNQFSAYELQNKILLEKSRHPLRMVSLVTAPALRIQLLMQTWLSTYKSHEMALARLEHQFEHLISEQHELIYRYRFNEIFQHIEASAVQQKIDLSQSHNKLFIFALTKLITQDSADLPASCKKYRLENLLADEFCMMNFIQSLPAFPLHFSNDFRIALAQQMKECSGYIELIQREPLEAWMMDFITKYTELRLQTIYYPHVDKPLASFYKELGYQTHASSHAPSQRPYSKLISIQLNSNRPAQLSLYFDNIEETADHPEDIEVLVNIDRDDTAMREMLEREIPERKFTIKYITTPHPESFCDLWKPINHLLDITDPGAYFLLNISDEMLFATPSWDSVLKKYVGFFPDHLFRLRASRNKLRNYFDRWECSFGQDAIPFTTRKWVEVGGDWNPCFGPDSFQQLISFYLAKEGQFSNEHYLRELPIIDILFHGDIPALGIDPEKSWRHNRDHIFAMEICQSHEMQQEARRRAMLLKSHIVATHQQIQNFRLVDDKKKKQIRLIDKTTQQTLSSMDYHVSWLAITLTNQIRKLRFFAYFGGGKEYPNGVIGGFAAYLKSKYQFCQKFFIFLHRAYYFLYRRGRELYFKIYHFIFKIYRFSLRVLRFSLRPVRKVLRQRHKVISFFK